MIPDHVKTSFIEMLNSREGKEVNIINVKGISGGCINDAVLIRTSQKSYFVKWNDALSFPGMFEAEARGLELLSSTSTVDVPQVVGGGKAGQDDFLVLEFIEQKSKDAGFWKTFGTSLADLHQNKGKEFGLDHDNYIGSLFQYNNQCDNWITFFIEQRLEVQLDLFRKNNRANRELNAAFSRLYSRLDDIFPEEPPALLHGDLWSGNYMTGNEGQPVIFDPAVYYGHRYMDLGMSKLFGGFDPEFYYHYNDQYPLENNWRHGIEVANLYPLLVHVNLFGEGYLGSVKEILKPFS